MKTFGRLRFLSRNLRKHRLRPAADAQSSGQVRVESERAIEAGGTVIEVTAYMAEDVSTVGARNRIVPPEFDRPPGQSSSFGNLFRIAPMIKEYRNQLPGSPETTGDGGFPGGL